MATPVLMPRLSPTMEEGIISEWMVKEGDSIEASDLLCEIETDKASMEYEAPDEGKILKILAPLGKTIKVDSLIAVIAEEGEELDLDAFIAENSKGSISNSSEKVEEEAEKEASNAAETVSLPPQEKASSTDDRIKASPLAKSIAKDKNLDLHSIHGSGPNGRIIKRDLENISESDPQSSAEQAFSYSDAGYEDVKNSTMRNVIAKRLLESSQGAPEFFLTMEINMDRVVQLRQDLKTAFPEEKITFNDIVIKATAIALRRNPKCNAYWNGDSIRYMKDVHISVAVAIEDGLITPVVRHADKIGLAEISKQVKNLAARAKDKKLQPEEYTGGTFSVSNLGMFGIEQFTSILNPPESGIFAVGGIVEKALVKNGELTIGKTMKITMTCDHRVIDGATGATLLSDVKNILENPFSLMV